MQSAPQLVGTGIKGTSLSLGWPPGSLSEREIESQLNQTKSVELHPIPWTENRHILLTSWHLSSWIGARIEADRGGR